MIQVSILLPSQCVVSSSLNSVCNIFDYANSWLINTKKKPAFTVAFIGLSPSVSLYDSNLSITPHYTLAQPPFQTDILIIPALAGNIADALEHNKAFFHWIEAAYEKGTTIAGLCTGTFMMANTQLVNKKACQRDWFVSDGFRKEFSQVNLVAENILQQEDAIATSCGAYHFFTQLLQCHVDEEAAEACAIMFEAGFNRECQSLFSITKRKEDEEKQTIQTPPYFFERKHQASAFSDKFYNSNQQNQAGIISNKKTAENTTDRESQSLQKRSNIAVFKKLLRNANVK